MLLGYSIGLLCSFGMFFLGRQMATRPEMLARVFFWAPRFASAYSRAVGRFFFIGGIVGVAFYLLLLLLLVVRHI